MRRVLKALDLVEHITSGIGQHQIANAVHMFALEQAQEAIHRSNITITAYRALGADDVVVLEELLVVRSGELRATIRVLDHWAEIGSLSARHHHRLEPYAPSLDSRHQSGDQATTSRERTGR